MSLSANRRIYRADDTEDDVFVVGGLARRVVAADGPVTTVTSLLDGARRRAEQIVAEAERTAAAIVAQAEGEAAEVRQAAQAAGIREGSAVADAEAARYLETIRSAAAEGIAIRDSMVEGAMPAIARAVAMACRRVVGAAFEADPSLTAAACTDAIRAAAGQQVISIRVNPGALDAVRASLVDFADYVRPDEAVELGGCLVDLRNGAIDATLESRLSLMELALLSSGGAAE